MLSGRVHSKSESDPIDVVGGGGRRGRRPSWLQEVLGRPVFFESPSEACELDVDLDSCSIGDGGVDGGGGEGRRVSITAGDGVDGVQKPPSGVRPKRSLSASFLSQFSLHDDYLQDVIKDGKRWNNQSTGSEEDHRFSTSRDISQTNTTTTSYQSGLLSSSFTSTSSSSSSSSDNETNDSTGRSGIKRNTSLPMLSSLIGRDTYQQQQQQPFDTSEVILFLSQGPK